MKCWSFFIYVRKVNHYPYCLPLDLGGKYGALFPCPHTTFPNLSSTVTNVWWRPDSLHTAFSTKCSRCIVWVNKFQVLWKSPLGLSLRHRPSWFLETGSLSLTRSTPIKSLDSGFQQFAYFYLPTPGFLAGVLGVHPGLSLVWYFFVT